MKAKQVVPLAVFVVLFGLFGVALLKMQSGEYNPREIPSVLIDKPAPPFTLSALSDPGKTVTVADLSKEVSLFNVWASWCVACRQEHPVLNAIAQQGTVPIYGLNYKDTRPAAQEWLARLGNPYVESAFDEKGRVGIDWGVYGVPETFIVDKRGMIRYKHIGPVSAEDWEKKLLPMIEKLKAEQG
ncbi:MAG: DsbE family thiol:disulfide interchange protein [Gammaproteobacteria bacterium]